MSDVRHIPSEELVDRAPRHQKVVKESPSDLKSFIANLGRNYSSESYASIIEDKTSDIERDLKNFTSYCLGDKSSTPCIYIYPAYLTDNGIRFISREVLNSFIEYQDETLPKICTDKGLSYGTVRRWKREIDQGKEFQNKDKVLKLLAGIRISRNYLKDLESFPEEFFSFYNRGELPEIKPFELPKEPEKKTSLEIDPSSNLDLDMLISTLESYKRHLIKDIQEIIKAV